MSITIREALPKELHLARYVATVTWPVAYSHILAAGQLEFMLTLFYSEKALLHQYHELKHHFYLAFDTAHQCIGFASYSFIDTEEKNKTYKLHKLYVLPDAQKLGTGRHLLQQVITAVREKGGHQLILNVNRYNNALQFYLKQGFEILKEEDIDIGEGYSMNDYVMSKDVQNF